MLVTRGFGAILLQQKHDGTQRKIAAIEEVWIKQSKIIRQLLRKYGVNKFTDILHYCAITDGLKEFVDQNKLFQNMLLQDLLTGQLF